MDATIIVKIGRVGEPIQEYCIAAVEDYVEFGCEELQDLVPDYETLLNMFAAIGLSNLLKQEGVVIIDGTRYRYKQNGYSLTKESMPECYGELEMHELYINNGSTIIIADA